MLQEYVYEMAAYTETSVIRTHRSDMSLLVFISLSKLFGMTHKHS